METEEIRVTLNGEIRVLPRACTIARLVGELGVTGGLVAVELNGQVVARDTFAAHELRDDDRLEILRLVGGG